MDEPVAVGFKRVQICDGERGLERKVDLAETQAQFKIYLDGRFYRHVSTDQLSGEWIYVPD